MEKIHIPLLTVLGKIPWIIQCNHTHIFSHKRREDEHRFGKFSNLLRSEKEGNSKT